MRFLKKYGFSLFKVLTGTLGAAYIINIAAFTNNLTSAYETFNISSHNILLLSVVLLLMPVNWLFEAIKWKLMIKPIEPISLKKSFWGVLAGITVSLIGPNRTGDFVGRISILQAKNRIAGTFISINTSFAQTIITLIIGFIGFVLYNAQTQVTLNSISPVYYILILVVFSLFLIFIYFYLYKLVLYFQKLSFFKKLKWDHESYQKPSQQLLLFNLLLSLFRYFVFTFQFILIFTVLQTPLTYYQLTLGISVMYLIMSALPTFTLAEPGIRGSVGILVFGAWGNFSGEIIAASTLIWLINVLLPAVPGIAVLVGINKRKG